MPDVISQLPVCYTRSEATPPRGDVADWLPHLPTPFTRSLFQAGWAHVLRQMSAGPAGQVSVPGWQVHEGVFFLEPRFWEEAGSVFGNVPAGLGEVVGVSLSEGGEEPAPRRRLLGFLQRGRPRGRWDNRREEVFQARDRAYRWFRRVRRARWDQAEILQVMEEIEAQAGQVLAAYVLATWGLADAASHRSREEVHALLGRMAVTDVPTLVPLVQAWEVVQAVREDRAARTWLLDTGGNAPVATMPDGRGREALARFLEAFPWLATQPYEVAAPRWSEEASPLVRWLASWATDREGDGIPAWDGGVTGEEDALVAWVLAREAAREGMGWVVAAARLWVLAAAQEGMEDGRLTSPEEAFLLKLEELKQMMTGEWNDPDFVQGVVQARAAALGEKGSACLPPSSNGRVLWLRRAGEVPTPAGAVGAAGWQPGWGVLSIGVEEIVTQVASPFGYGNLLALALGVRIERG